MASLFQLTQYCCVQQFEYSYSRAETLLGGGFTEGTFMYFYVEQALLLFSRRDHKPLN